MAGLATGRASGLQSKIEGRDVYVKAAPGQDVKDPRLASQPSTSSREAYTAWLSHPSYGMTRSTQKCCQSDSRPRNTHASGDTLVILTLYVDDSLMTGKDESVVRRF